MDVPHDIDLVSVSNAVQTKTIQDFPAELRHVIDLLALNDTGRPVGSGAFTVHLYPSDLDLFERASGCCGSEDAAAYFASRLQTNAKRISLDDGVYFSELKAGVDMRFQPASLGHKDLADDAHSIQPATLREFNARGLRQWVGTAAHIQLISEEEEKEVGALVEQAERDSNKNWQELHNWFRKRWVLRWTLEEVIAGRKEIRRDNRMPCDKTPYLTLARAILQGTLVKMDLITFSEGRLVPAEAVYDLYAFESAADRANGARPGHLTLDMGDYATNLRRDVIMYSGEHHFNPLKVAKRVWALAVQQKYAPLIGALSALFRSDVASVNQVLADAKEVRKAVKDQPAIPKQKLVNVLLTFPKRLANHVAPESIVYQQSVAVSQQWYSLYTQDLLDAKAAELLDPLIGELQVIVNRNATAYMQPLVPMLRQITLGLTGPAATGHILLAGPSSPVSVAPPMMMIAARDYNRRRRLSRAVVV